MTIHSRTLLAASLSATLAAAVILSAAPALAQAGTAAKPAAGPPAAKAEAPEAGKEIALTQGQIDGLLVAQPELAKLTGGAPDKPDPKAEAQAQGQAEAIVKRNGFASLEEFQDASDTVDAVLGGIDPETKSYVGATPLLKKQLAAVQADTAMPAQEKAETVKEIKEALAAGEPAKPSEANIALVTKNYARLSAAMGEGQDKE
ncbi:Small secreted protein [Methylorubrum thiocyanatum]